MVKRQPQKPGQSVAGAGTAVMMAELERDRQYQDDLNDRADVTR